MMYLQLFNGIVGWIIGEWIKTIGGVIWIDDAERTGKYSWNRLHFHSSPTDWNRTIVVDPAVMHSILHFRTQQFRYEIWNKTNNRGETEEEKKVAANYSACSLPCV